MSEHHFPPDWRQLDPRVRREPVQVHATDGYPLHGTLYSPPQVEPDVAVLAMHPRADFSRHYLAPHLALGGYAFFGCNTRHLNNDADAQHERLLLDVAGALRWLRARYSKVVLLGNSGGASLFGLYLEQALQEPSARLARTPGGDRTGLAEAELPTAEGLLLVAAHQGEGRFLLERLDASVVDEGEPTAANPRLDMYDPSNGYRPMQLGPSSYSPDFVAELRAAQRARCDRLDRRARAWCEEAAYWRARTKLGGELPLAERVRAAKGGLVRRYFVIYRTLADPRYLDPTLDASRRPLGSLFAIGGRDPVAANYGEGLARTMSARGWLSTWSGLVSNADLTRTLARVTVPTLIVYADGDTEVYEREQRELLAASGARDKEFVTVPWADHYFLALGDEGARLGDARVRLAQDVVLPWLRQRWPV